jgi:hypothetical protein
MLFKSATLAYSLIGNVDLEKVREVVYIIPQKRADYLSKLGPKISTKGTLVEKIVLFKFFEKRKAKKRVKAINREIRDKYINPWNNHAEYFQSCQSIPLPRDGEIDYLFTEIGKILSKAKKERELNAHQSVRLSHLSYLLMKETI